MARKNLVGKRVRNRDDGVDIEINWQGLKHDTGAQVTDKNLVTLTKLPEMLEVAKRLRSEPDKAGRQHIKAVHTYGTRVDIDGVPYDVSLVVREHTDGHRFYDHYVAEPAGISGDATQAYSERRTRQPSAGSGSIIDDSDKTPNFGRKARTEKGAKEILEALDEGVPTSDNIVGVPRTCGDELLQISRTFNSPCCVPHAHGDEPRGESASPPLLALSVMHLMRAISDHQNHISITDFQYQRLIDNTLSDLFHHIGVAAQRV